MTITNCPPRLAPLRALRRLSAAAGVIAAVAIWSGCGSPSSTPDVTARGQASRAADGRVDSRIDDDQLDALTNAYSDRFMTLIVGAADTIKADNPSPEQRRMAHLIKTASVASIYDIASNPDPFTQLVDMLLVVSLLAQTWIDEARADDIFGDRADLLVLPLRRAREEIWEMAARVMRPEQLESLDLLIWQWRRDNQDVNFTSFVRFDDFAGSRSRAIVSEVRRGGGFLAPIDQARVEVERTRRLAERAFFYAKRVGMLAAWEAEALALELMVDPTIRQAIDNSTSLATSIDRASTTFAELPDRLGAERDALVEALDVRQEALDGTLRELQGTSRDGERLAASITETFNASERMLVQLERTSGALSETIAAADVLAGRFEGGRGGTEAAPAGDAPAFAIAEYTEAIATLADTARELNRLVASSLALIESDAFTKRLEDATREGETFADLLFRRMLALLAAFFAMLLTYKAIVLWLRRRFAAETPRSPGTPERSDPARARAGA